MDPNASDDIVPGGGGAGADYLAATPTAGWDATTLYAGQSGNDPNAGTSAQVSGTTSDLGGGADYITAALQAGTLVGLQALSPGPVVQPILSAGKPYATPASAIAGGYVGPRPALVGSNGIGGLSPIALILGAGLILLLVLHK
jgi:hypothetical protein